MNGTITMPVRSAVRVLIARENVRWAETSQPELTQSEIAANSGVSQSVISTLMTGKSRRIDFETIDKLCKYFNVEPGALFIREKESEEEK